MGGSESKWGQLVWQPKGDYLKRANIVKYQNWLAETYHRNLPEYIPLWLWSIQELGPFWQTIADYFGVKFSVQPKCPIEKKVMPGAHWFPGGKLNYAEHVLSHARMPGDAVALIEAGEDRTPVKITWDQLRNQVSSMATFLSSHGVKPGDRVAAYLTNTSEAVVSMLATATIGAVWSSCASEFGRGSTVDRFGQITPKILIARRRYRYAGREFDRSAELGGIIESLPSLESVVLVGEGDHGLENLAGRRVVLFEDALRSRGKVEFVQVDFSHPLWILYSSGTTGLPKGIVHGHGGIVLEHLKALSLHNDLHPDDVFFWYTSTGWMMWNYLVGGLLAGSTVVLYDGSPSYPRADSLWELSEKLGITFFGTSAAYLLQCMKSKLKPADHYDLSKLRGVGSTGSPLTPDGFGWVYSSLKKNIWLASISGGTDICSGFLVGLPTLSVYAGELQCRALGARVEAFDEDGSSILEEVGELVVLEPMPSMPLYLWGDTDGSKYREAYFSVYPGVWRHGDWIRITERWTAVIYGRSDSTIKRHGLRLGTSEIYRVVESLEEVADSLAIDLENLEGEGSLLLFIVPRPGFKLDDTLSKKIRSRIKTELSPRFIPDQILEVRAIPRTLNGKKLEIPVKRILIGVPSGAAVNPGSVNDPKALDELISKARECVPVSRHQHG